MNSKRDYSIDFLRIISSIMVIVIHICCYKWYELSPDSFSWKTFNVYDSFVRPAVPLFIMISGIFFLSKKITIKQVLKKYSLRLVIIYIFWSFIYALFSVRKETFSFILVKQIIKSTIEGPFHFWFIPTIVGLYLLSPILKLIVDKMNEDLKKYFVILFIVSSFFETLGKMSFLPEITYITSFVNILPLKLILQFSSYFILGHILYNSNIKIENKKLFFGYLINVILCFTFTYLVCKHNGANDSSLYQEFSIFTLLEAISLFLIFKNIKNSTFFEKEKNIKIISFLSSKTFGIYIIHFLILQIVFEYILPFDFINTIIFVPFITIIAFIFSILAVFLLGKIKIIKKYLI